MTGYRGKTGRHVKKRRTNPYSVFFFLCCVLLAFSVVLNIVAVKRLNESLEQTAEAISVAKQAQTIADQALSRVMYQEWCEAEAGYQNREEEPNEVPSETLTVVATAYCPCVSCCGEWSSQHPSRVGTDYAQRTYSGTIPVEGRTIATDPTVIPTGSRVLIGDHEYIAEDVGGAIKGNHIDIYFDSHQEALEWGRQTVEVIVFENKTQ